MRFLLHHLLQATARSAPDRPAVVAGRDTLSYGELDARSNQLAHLLIDRGVHRGDRVGLHLDKSSPTSIVLLYAVLKAGAAYVPLDPAAPAERLAQVVTGCEIQTVVSGTADVAPAALPGVQLVMAEPAVIAAQPADPPRRDVLDTHASYILPTSGSTGVPKGVVHTHRSALAFVEWAVETFGVTPADRLASPAPLHFDLSVFDVFAAARAGATLVLVPPRARRLPAELGRFLARERVTVLYAVPSALTLLGERGDVSAGSLPELRAVLFAGEVFAPAHLRRLMTLLPEARFANLYGPTETNVCTWHPVARAPVDDVPASIGRAIRGDEVVVVSGDGTPAADGELGELWVRGATLMSGYRGDDEQTRRVLAPSLDGRPGPWYRTGDLVRRDAAGDHWFAGRRDAQVKTRGHRVELGDVESALAAHPAVLECAVIALPDPLVGNRLVAHAAVRDGTTARDLARACASRLSRYMVPERFVLYDALPHTSSGKVDRTRLAREPAAPFASARR